MTGTYTTNKWLYKPAYEEQFNTGGVKYNDAFTAVDSRLGNEVWVGDPKFADSALYTPIQKLINATNQIDTRTRLRIPAGTYSVTSDLVIDSDLVILAPEPGAIFQITGSGKLTCCLECGLWQCFDDQTTGLNGVVLAKTPNAYPEWFGAIGDGETDDYNAVQSCLNAIETSNSYLNLTKMFAVNDTVYFGDQSISGSISPAGIIGYGWSTGLKAITGCNGTVLQAWSVGHKKFENFYINGNNIAVTCFDSSWKGGLGPSLQNRYINIRCENASGTIWIATDNNDCVLDQCVCVGSDNVNHDQIGIDLSAPGGLVWIRDCIWSYSYLKFKSQNGRIENSWGHGILFGSTCLNYISLDGCYIYGNKTLNACLASESFNSQQSIRSLICNSTQFISVSPSDVDVYFDLNLYSIFELNGCQFIGTASNMFSNTTRSDSYAAVRVRFNGGSMPGSTLTINELSGFEIETYGFMDDDTGYAVPIFESLFIPVVRGKNITGVGTYTSQSGVYRIIGNLVEFEVAISWTLHTGTGQLEIIGFPFTQIGQTSVIIGYTGNTFGTEIVTINLNGNIASIWKWNGDPFDIVGIGNLALSGVYRI
jgi:hypothetical protein